MNKRSFFSWKNCIAILYGVIGIAILLYSYTQVDLGLTLSRASIWLTIQRWLQHIGYFQRPLSTFLYIGIISMLFILYAIVIFMLRKKILPRRYIWIFIGIITVTTCLSYPAFSYDFFNYLFTAKTVLVYHKNPYEVIPLQFSGLDSWLSFMHWTHLPSAYTPLWILLTLAPYLLGFGYFLFLMWNLKIFIALSYCVTAWGIQRILSRDTRVSALGVAIFALNPLIIIECLVSSHNDIMMMALAVWAIVFYKEGKRWLSWILLSFSVALKLMTIFLIPAFFLKWKKSISLLCMGIGFTAVFFQREALSWYWVWMMPFIALLPNNTSIVIVSTGISAAFLLQYAPFLYFGNWNDPVPSIKTWVTILPIGVSIIIGILQFFREKKYIKNTA